jgi:hypothetical protein
MSSMALRRIQQQRGIFPSTIGGSRPPAIVGAPETRGVGVQSSILLSGDGSKIGVTGTGQLALTTLLVLILGLVAVHVWTREFQA